MPRGKRSKGKKPRKNKNSRQKNKSKKSKNKNEDNTIHNNSNSNTNNNQDMNAVSSETKEMTVAEKLMERKPRRWKVDSDKEFTFWGTQPVPGMKEEISMNTNIAIEQKTLKEVRVTPLALPKRFEWSELDLSNDNSSDLDEFYELLSNHYVEDDDNMFRFNYSRDFLLWAVCIPGHRIEWQLGVRVVKSGTLVGCITAIPAKVGICHSMVSMVEINFLCVHKNLRTNRLAPVLIREITRRVNMCNIWQAVYTAGVVIPKPIASNRYWHRSLNPKKLIEVGFSSMKKMMTVPRLMRIYKLPKKTSTLGLRVMVESDCEAVHQLLIEYLLQFKLYVHFSIDEFKHCFLSKKNVVYSYVVENVNNHQITDFISFYSLPSSILNNAKHTEMRAAYSFYNVCEKSGWKEMMMDALILAKNKNFDVFNALDVMENEKFLHCLKFGIGDGHLQYYVYNWKCPEMKPNSVALVLL